MAILDFVPYKVVMKGLIGFVFILALFGLTGMPPATAHDTHEGEGSMCLTSHVKAAIEFNKERRKVYFKKGGAEAKKAVSRLIRFERLMLPISWFIDQKAKKIQKEGVPFVCRDLMLMSNVAPLTELDFVPPLIKFPKNLNIPLKKIKKELRKKLKDQDFLGFAQLTQKYIDDVSYFPSYFCLYRHFLESLRRSAQLAPVYAAMMKDQKKLYSQMTSYLKWQLIGMGPLLKLDLKAWPLQEKGIPLYCRDVPYIPEVE